MALIRPIVSKETSEVYVTMSSTVASNGGQACLIPAELIKNATACTIGANEYSSDSTPINNLFFEIIKVDNGTNYFLTTNNTWSTTEAKIYSANSGTVSPSSVFASVDLSNLTEITKGTYARMYCSRSSSGNINVKFAFS